MIKVLVELKNYEVGYMNGITEAIVLALEPLGDVRVISQEELFYEQIPLQEGDMDLASHRKEKQKEALEKGAADRQAAIDRKSRQAIENAKAMTYTGRPSKAQNRRYV